MKNIGRILALILVLALMLSCAPTALASTEEQDEAAERLYSLGLFFGTGVDGAGNPIFELDRVPTRAEAITMLVRLLGKEEEARSRDWGFSFTDVPTWAVPYVGYAYNHNLANGYSTLTFGSNDPVTATMFLTFVLRALGYSSETDFQWDAAWQLSDQLGLSDGHFRSKVQHLSRGDLALICSRALDLVPKNGVLTLLEDLQERGAARVPDGYDNLVTEAFHLEADVPNGLHDYHRVISIPKINLNSDAARKFNAEMGSLWDVKWDPKLVDWEKETPFLVDFKYSVNLGILSVVVHIVNYWESDVYRVVNLMLPTGDSVSNEDLIAVTGAQEELFPDRCRRTVLGLYELMSRGIDGPLAQNGIAYCKQAVSNGDVSFATDTLQLYFSKGTLCCCTTVPWYAGSGNLDVDLELMSFAEINAIRLWNWQERQGGYQALAAMGSRMEDFALATEWAHNRIFARTLTKYLAGMAVSLGLMAVGAEEEGAKHLLSQAAGLVREAIVDEALPNLNDVVFLLFEMAKSEDPQALANAHRNLNPNLITDAQAREYLRLWYGTRINFATILMTYYFFFDQDAKTMGDYLNDLGAVAADALWEFVPEEKTLKKVGDVLQHVKENGEYGVKAAAAIALQNAVESFADGRPEALLKLAGMSKLKEVKRWGVIVSQDLTSLHEMLYGN